MVGTIQPKRLAAALLSQFRLARFTKARAASGMETMGLA